MFTMTDLQCWRSTSLCTDCYFRIIYYCSKVWTWWVFFFIFEVCNAHKACIYLIENTIKNVLLINIYYYYQCWKQLCLACWNCGTLFPRYFFYECSKFNFMNCSLFKRTAFIWNIHLLLTMSFVTFDLYKVLLSKGDNFFQQQQKLLTPNLWMVVFV